MLLKDGLDTKSVGGMNKPAIALDLNRSLCVITKDLAPLVPKPAAFPVS